MIRIVHITVAAPVLQSSVPCGKEQSYCTSQHWSSLSRLAWWSASCLILLGLFLKIWNAVQASEIVLSLEQWHLFSLKTTCRYFLGVLLVVGYKINTETGNRWTYVNWMSYPGLLLFERPLGYSTSLARQKRQLSKSITEYLQGNIQYSCEAAKELYREKHTRNCKDGTSPSLIKKSNWKIWLYALQMPSFISTTNQLSMHFQYRV